jgi:hypothetical protein
VLVPLVVVILFMALYPQLALHRSEGSAKLAVAAPAAPSARAALAPARHRPGRDEGALLAKTCHAGAVSAGCPPRTTRGSPG